MALNCLFVHFDLQNKTKRTKNDQKNRKIAVGVVEASSSSLVTQTSAMGRRF